MSKKIILIDVFDGYCEYEQCIYNDNKQCFIKEHISEYMVYREGNYATCNGFTIKEGYCEECGKQLIKAMDKYPYGDTFAEYKYFICPNGC